MWGASTGLNEKRVSVTQASKETVEEGGRERGREGEQRERGREGEQQGGRGAMHGVTKARESRCDRCRGGCNKSSSDPESAEQSVSVPPG